MPKNLTLIVLCLFLFLFPHKIIAQVMDRSAIIQERLDAISANVPGLGQNVQLLITGLSIQDYLSALAKLNKLSISIDPKLTFNVYDTFNDVTAENILLLLAKKYNLDITTVGSIIYITPYQVRRSLLSHPGKRLISNIYNWITH